MSTSLFSNQVIQEGNVIAQQLINSSKILLGEEIRKALNTIPSHLNIILPLLKRYEWLSKTLKELGIPEELFIKAVIESLKTLHKVCNNVCQYKEALPRIEPFSDVEVKEWKGIMLKFSLKGNYETLLNVWDELSRTLFKVLGKYSKYVYVMVEPYE